MARIEKIFFYLLVFFLPFQARALLKSFSEPFSEWNSISFYLTDLLLLAVIFLWILRVVNSPSYFKRGLGGVKKNKAEIALVLFWLIGALSIFKAENFWISVFREIKLIEFGVLFLYLKNNFWKNSPYPPLDSRGGIVALIISGLLQSFIAIGQFLRQKSFGLSFLDESPLAPDLPGVAKIAGESGQLIRGYGLAPHPNVLAAFLLMAIFAFIFVFLKKEKWLVWEKIIYPFSFFILLTGLALTFSRTIILAGSAAILAWLLYLYVKKIDRKKIFAVFLLFAISYMLLAILLWPLVTNRFAPSALEGQAYDLRVFYSHKALEFLDQDPLLGVGIGNFVPYSMQKEKLAEAWMYQPAHNLYLLIAAEIGILGSMVFLILLFLILIGFYRFALKNPAFLGIFLLAVSYALLANTDHFFWTLQQGGLMFWSVLGIMSGAGKSPEPR